MDNNLISAGNDKSHNVFCLSYIVVLVNVVISESVGYFMLLLLDKNKDCVDYHGNLVKSYWHLADPFTSVSNPANVRDQGRAKTPVANHKEKTGIFSIEAFLYLCMAKHKVKDC